MDFKITSEVARPMLSRREVEARIAYEGKTPAREEIRTQAAAQLKTKPEQVVVTKIVPEAGSPSASVSLRVYSDEKALKEIEHQFQLKRHGLVDKAEPAKEQ